MAGKSPMINPSVLVVLAAVYHACTFAADAEAYVKNLRRLGADPSMANLIRVVVAEGVLIKDLGLAG